MSSSSSRSRRHVEEKSRATVRDRLSKLPPGLPSHVASFLSERDQYNAIDAGLLPADPQAPTKYKNAVQCKAYTKRGTLCSNVHRGHRCRDYCIEHQKKAVKQVLTAVRDGTPIQLDGNITFVAYDVAASVDDTPLFRVRSGDQQADINTFVKQLFEGIRASDRVHLQFDADGDESLAAVYYGDDSDEDENAWEYPEVVTHAYHTHARNALLQLFPSVRRRVSGTDSTVTLSTMESMHIDNPNISKHTAIDRVHGVTQSDVQLLRARGISTFGDLMDMFSSAGGGSEFKFKAVLLDMGMHEVSASEISKLTALGASKRQHSFDDLQQPLGASDTLYSLDDLQQPLGANDPLYDHPMSVDEVLAGLPTFDDLPPLT